MFNEITANGLKELLDKDPNSVILVDVRESYEFEYGHLPSLHIPIGEVSHRYHEIPESTRIVVCCRSGSRSMNVIKYLSSQHNFQNLYYLKGGLLAWQQDVDAQFRVY